MKNKIIIWGIVCTMLCVPMSLVAQHNVSGYVKSAADQTVIEMATVRLFAFHGQDSVMVQGCQTGMDGMFLMVNVANGKYKLYVSSVGFREESKWLQVEEKDVDMGIIRLKEEVMQLGEVNVQGHAAEMVVKGDTIEYNTSAYKVAENAMVEDLLKKMNGVEVDKEGNVTINGEQIKAVRIDGKKFFGDDVQTATKNIPADMIDKVQVIDEKSEVAKMTGFEDDETERIINLSLKQNKKKGVFGNFGGALGADISKQFRYNANVFTNLLLGESQTTILGGANNTNEIRSGRGRGPFSGQNSGITWSENLGVNTNLDLSKSVEKKDNTSALTFGGDALMNHSYNDTRSLSTKESYSTGSNYHNQDSTTKLSNAWDAMMRLEFEYQIDSMNKLLIMPRISYTNNRSSSHNSFLYEHDSVLVNDGYQNQKSLSEDISANVRVIYNHKFAHPGRALNIMGNVDFTNTKGESTTFSWDNIKTKSTVDQNTRSLSNSLGYRMRVSYVEPLYKTNHLLEIAAMFQGRDRASNKDQYSMDSITHTYKYDSVYSNMLDNHLYTEQLELNYRWVEEKWDLTLGARVLATQTHSRTYYGGLLDRDTTYNQWNWSPNIRFKYKFGKKEFARIMYRGQVNQPTITQMEPVRNNSDALNETVGNLSLQPAFTHNLHGMYSRFNQDNFSSIMCGLHGSITKDALVSNTIYDETGKSYRQTINATTAPWNLGGRLMYNIPFCNKMFQFHTHTSASYNQQVAYVLREQSAAEIERMIAAGTVVRGQESKTGKVSVGEDLNLRFTHSIADVGVKGTINYTYTNNSLNLSANSTHTLDWSVTGDLTFHLPRSWNIQADCGYTARYGYTGLEDVNEVILNASIDKTWGNATLSLKAYDILNQKKNIVQVVSDNSITWKQSNTLPTYFMLTFSYRLNKMGNLKAKGVAGFMQEAIEQGNKPGQMPTTPPPPMM